MDFVYKQQNLELAVDLWENEACPQKGRDCVEVWIPLRNGEWVPQYQQVKLFFQQLY